MITVNFDKNELCKKAYGLWQYDYGQVLRIQGLNLPTAVEMHFSLSETGGEAVTRIGITKDGVTDVTIPDSLLEADGASQDYQIYVFIYLATPDSGETTRRITLGVKSRPRPEVFDTPGEEELFEGAVQAVNDAAKRAEEAGKEATAAAGEARESASQAGKHLADTQALAEQVEINADTVAQGAEKAKELLAQTQEVASNAVISAQAAKQAEMAAREAQTAAESAEDAARQYAAGTEADRQEVAEKKQSVTQMQSNVARMQADVRADKEAVEQTVTGFGAAAQTALTAIGQAQNTAVSAVQAEGQKQATAVQETGTQAIDEIDTAKTAAVGAVASEGDKQVVRVQEAAAEIVADREQIQHNKADITTLSDKTNTLAPGIVLGTKGGTITVSNASEQPLVGLTVYGKSTQASEPSVEHPQEILSAGDSGEINVNVLGKNLADVSRVTNATGADIFEKIQNGYILTSCGMVDRISYIPCKLKKGVKYTASFDIKYSENVPDDVKVNFYLPETQQYTIKTFICIADCTKVGLYFDDAYTGKGYTAQITNLQVEIGSAATSYEPYKQPQPLTLKTPNGLPGIPVKSGGNYTDSKGQRWVCDEIDLSEGERVQRIKAVNAKDLDWRLDPTGNIKRFSVNNISDIRKNGTLMSNRFVRANYAQADNTCSNEEDGKLRVVVNSTIDTVDKVKQLFAENDTVFHYELTTPIRTPLSPEEIASYKALHTYAPNTTIINDAGCGMSLTYIADTQRYIDKKIAAISAAMIGG